MGRDDPDASTLAPGTHIRLDATPARPWPYRGVAAELYRWIGLAWLRLFGWRIVGDWPRYPKAVAIGAPHTTNWDGALLIAFLGAMRMKMSWMGKASLVRGPFGGLVRRLGCIPIDRTKSNDVVGQMTARFAAAGKLILGIPPEGTRTPGAPWKSGFYHIAVAAKVPIVICLLDWGTRHIRISGVLMPSGDFDADMAMIRTHYAGIRGKFTPPPSAGSPPRTI